jgi:hypothetical protein
VIEIDTVDWRRGESVAATKTVWFALPSEAEEIQVWEGLARVVGP